MAKNILSFFGLIFLTILIIVGVLILGFFLDSLGLVTLPDEMDFLRTPPAGIALPGQVTPTVRVEDIVIATAEWTNPLEMLPTPTITPIPTELPTPVPPLDPTVYRAETMVRLKAFAGALDRWLQANEKLGNDKDLLENEEWRAEMLTILDDVEQTGGALAAIGPPPPQYASIDALLNNMGPESATLSGNYRRAIQTGNSKNFSAASENFTRIKTYLTQAVAEMTAAGWTAE